ncbi:type II toxin-antitoxin system Phd/YefM family antitoxin [Patescibacteria group bacterium]|nr:type II toxin-antitoxin system Phd/YefM family antitoxin [Patescibacteria group bacterium]
MDNLAIFANFPDTASAREIQRNYRTLFNRVKKTRKPLLIISNNKPDVAVVNYDDLAALIRQFIRYEERLALAGITESRRQWRKGKFEVLKGKLTDLWDEN